MTQGNDDRPLRPLAALDLFAADDRLRRADLRLSDPEPAHLQRRACRPLGLSADHLRRALELPVYRDRFAVSPRHRQQSAALPLRAGAAGLERAPGPAAP